MGCIPPRMMIPKPIVWFMLATVLMAPTVAADDSEEGSSQPWESWEPDYCIILAPGYFPPVDVDFKNCNLPVFGPVPRV